VIEVLKGAVLVAMLGLLLMATYGFWVFLQDEQEQRRERRSECERNKLERAYRADE
jgi:Tfp pilus assembly protein PilO